MASVRTFGLRMFCLIPSQTIPANLFGYIEPIGICLGISNLDPRMQVIQSNLENSTLDTKNHQFEIIITPQHANYAVLH